MKYSYTKKSGEVVEKELTFDVKAYNTQYYQQKKEHLNERIECPCGLSHARCNKTAHQRGRVHQLYEKLTKNQPPPETLAI